MLGLVLLFPCLIIVLQLLWNAFRPGLRSIPGPFLAKFTNLWRFYYVRNGLLLKKLQDCHHKYGTLVRLGPNLVSVSDARMMDSIYGTKANFVKSDWYQPNQYYQNGQYVHSVFGTQDRAIHAKLRKPVAGIYSMTSIASYEPLTDDIIIKFLRVLNERFIRTGKTCPIDQWFQYLAFDVVSMVTMSRPMGFVEQGGDVDGLLAQLETEFSYRLQTGIFPVWDTILRKNKFVSWLSRNTVSPFLKRSREILDDRVKALHERDAEKYSDEMGRDFVSRFFEQKEKNPTEVSDNMLLMYVTQNIVAGSDTTAIVLRSILYRLMKNPNALATLRAELDAANPTFPIPYSVAYKLPYLTAVVKECLRLHPIGGSLLLERIVPSTGLKVLDSDVVLPGGTIVGSTGWMTAFDKRVFGEDAGVFRPERWLKGEHETHEAFKERLSMMNSSDLSFGKGSRLCLGKHIAELELFKVLPTLVALLDIEMDPPGKEWDVEYLFFAKQSGMDVKIKWRKGVVQEEIIG